jgi:hypothetical protein
MDDKKNKEIANKIVEIIKTEKCTVNEVNRILRLVYKEIGEVSLG